MMFSKKYFIMVANIVAKIKDKKERYKLAFEFADMFEISNSQFDRRKFLAYIKKKGGECNGK